MPGIGQTPNLAAVSLSNFRSTCGLVAMTSASHAEGRQLDPGQVYTMWAPSVRRAAQRAVAVVTHMRADANARRFSVPPRAYGRVRWLHIPSVYARGQRVNGSVASIRHAHRHMCVPHGCSDRGVVVWVCVCGHSRLCCTTMRYCVRRD